MPYVKFRLFLSHSSPTDDNHVEQIADELLKAAPCKVEIIFDRQEITSSADWRERVCYMLHTCDSAVLLLNEKALSSPWVLAEATFLSFRETIQKDFHLAPVALADEHRIKRRLQSPRWGPINLRRLQFASDADPAKLAKKIWAGFDATCLNAGGGPLEQLAGQMAHVMEDAPVSGLKQLVAELDNLPPHLASNETIRCAALVAREVIQRPSLYAARDRIGKLGRPFFHKHARQLVEMVSPLRFDPAAAAALRISGPDGRNHVLLQSRHPTFTVKQYVERAFLAEEPPELIWLRDMDGSPGDARLALREAARDQLWHGNGQEYSDEQIDSRLRKSKLSTFVASRPLDADVLAEVSSSYPNLTFVFYHDKNHPSEPVESVVRSLPRLEPDQEEDFKLEYEDVVYRLQPRTA